MTTLSRLRLRRMFNTRAERFRRWLKLYLQSPDARAAALHQNTGNGPSPELSPDTLHRLFYIWARRNDPDALKEDETAPKLMMV